MTDSERRGRFEGVVGAARPLQRTDRFDGGVVVVEAGVRMADAGLGR